MIFVLAKAIPKDDDAANKIIEFAQDLIENSRKEYPHSLILAHPECHHTVSEIADFVGSTTEIMKFAKESSDKQFVIATEKGVVDRLKRDYPEKEFILIKDIKKNKTKIRVAMIFENKNLKDKDIFSYNLKSMNLKEKRF